MARRTPFKCGVLYSNIIQRFCANMLLFAVACRICSGGELSINQLAGNNQTNNNAHLNKNVTLDKIAKACMSRCPEDNRTISGHLNVDCGKECYVKQCTLGCSLWKHALESTCSAICNKNEGSMVPKDLYCVMGCNDAKNRYFQWLKEEVGTPPAPALVADSLTATSLSLEWQVPSKLLELTKGKYYYPKSYLVQWRYEEVAGDWKFCRNQSMGDNSTVRVDNLHPYTKYRFRVALILSPNYDGAVVSEQSVVISTLAKGVPTSQPAIVRAVAVDHTRISVSWEPGPFSNGPILSYVVQIKDLSSGGLITIKDIPASEKTNSYMCDKLSPNTTYSVLVSTRNAEGEGPAAESIVETPPQPLTFNEPDPKLILGGAFAVFSQGSDILSESAEAFYESDHRIVGIAIHIEMQLIFVSDEAGYVNRASVEKMSPKTTILGPHSGFNFRPQLLSLDWLNLHLYILGQVAHPSAQHVWQISRCDFTGQTLTIAIAGLHKQPSHIQVDPYNGYLFWVISGCSSDAGLFRLDLGDISNGIRHEVKPFHLIQGENLGAFTVDYRTFRILVPVQDNNTVIAVTHDGKTFEDIRKNTQNPKFKTVISLDIANGTFYWTNGNVLFMEEHHLEEDSYYHNVYPDLTPGGIVAICTNIPSAQPIPVPVNPPRNLQVLLCARKAKISWEIPHLLANQGKGAWQDWNYEIEVVNFESGSRVIRNIKGFYYMVDNLKANTNYTFRAAAYTLSGKGPWSLDFQARTLESDHQLYLIWGSTNGLLQSDVIGEHIITLLTKSEIGENSISDISWFEDTIFFVSNFTLKFFNRTRREIGSFDELGPVGSIGIDWLGRRIYWSNPTQQSVIRANLDGKEVEPLPIIAVVRELKVDSFHGYIYYSTGHAVEFCRLNGKHRNVYYNVNIYSGKQVLGLAIDIRNEMLFWIVQSYDGSSLFRAPMAVKWKSSILPQEIKLQERSLNGPLVYFSDRLLWFENDHTIVVGDNTGKNLAYVRDPKLIGLRSVGVIDPTQHVYPNITPTFNVIPEQIKKQSINIEGTWDSFMVTWSSTNTVTYGDVFYELRIRSELQDDIVQETSSSYYKYFSTKFPPYTLLDIAIRSFTYWASSKPSYVALRSPPAAPSAPKNPRVFLSYSYSPFKLTPNIEALFRWDPPDKPNGPIVGYNVECWYTEGENNKTVCGDVFEVKEEAHILGLPQNVVLFFQVQGSTTAGKGPKTPPLIINPNARNSPPILLAANNENILRIDLDVNKSQPVLNIDSKITDMTYIQQESRLICINENNELISYDGTKSKLFTASSKISSLSVDWVERAIYWSQYDENKGGSIHTIDLIGENYRPLKAENIINSLGYIWDLIVLPTKQVLFWLESRRKESTYGKLVQHNIQKQVMETFQKYSNCLNGVFQHILLDSTSIDEPNLILVNQQGQIALYNLTNNSCHILNLPYEKNTRQIAKGDGKYYLLSNDRILTYNNELQLEYVTRSNNITKIFAFNLQTYPPRYCLVPSENAHIKSYVPLLAEKEENTLLLRLPRPFTYQNCSIKLPRVKYSVNYSVADGNTSEWRKLTFFEESARISNLKAFTRYKFQIGINNYYGEKVGMGTVYGPIVIFSTAPGPPSPPRDVMVETVSPNEAVIQWKIPIRINSDSLWFHIHWQTESSTTRTVNSQHRLIELEENLLPNSEELIAVRLSKLKPCRTYNIWIEAFSSNKTSNVSPVVKTTTFPEPENITLLAYTPYSLELHWKVHTNISKYILQYCKTGYNNFTVAAESVNDDKTERGATFFINNLQPRTEYQFVLHLFFAKRSTVYVWPPDNVFKFQTPGDKPSAPGTPVVYHVSGEVYKVSWEPASENGAHIEQYSLEALRSKVQERIVRMTKWPYTENISFNQATEVFRRRIRVVRAAKIEDAGHFIVEKRSRIINSTIFQSELPWVEEPEVIEEKWTERYNGLDSYWIVEDLRPISLYVFRVRAKNSYGWGPFSSLSQPISELHTSQGNRESLLLAIFVPTIVIVACISFFGCFLLAVKRKVAPKKILEHHNIRASDLELANLRELPRGNNIFHTNNVLYQSRPLSDADVALLPQINKNQVTMTSFLGSGAFGEVYEGCINSADPDNETRVAIKTLRKGATEQEKSEFLQEAKLMSNFKHDHILRLIGICFDSDVLYIIMELMQGGDLLSYLRQSRPAMGVSSQLTFKDLILMCVDVASGCRYLEQMHFVHRDLACRNCLVSSINPQQRVVKIGDFGLARDIYKNDYYRKEGEGLLPVRWMSPESLMDGVFTSQSDIWAFGVLCWEIMTLGQQPYPARNNLEVLQYVRDGGRLGKPAGCPDELYKLMLLCWSYCPEDRPTFKYCLEILEALKANTSNYSKITLDTVCQAGNDGVSNPSYLGSDENHNQEIDTKTRVHSETYFETQVIKTPCSSLASSITPKYLELLCNENDDFQTIENVKVSSYEVPLCASSASGLSRSTIYLNSSGQNGQNILATSKNRRSSSPTMNNNKMRIKNTDENAFIKESTTKAEKKSTPVYSNT